MIYRNTKTVAKDGFIKNTLPNRQLELQNPHTKRIEVNLKMVEKRVSEE